MTDKEIIDLEQIIGDKNLIIDAFDRKVSSEVKMMVLEDLKRETSLINIPKISRIFLSRYYYRLVVRYIQRLDFLQFKVQETLLPGVMKSVPLFCVIVLYAREIGNSGFCRSVCDVCFAQLISSIWFIQVPSLCSLARVLMHGAQIVVLLDIPGSLMIHARARISQYCQYSLVPVYSPF